MQQSEEKKQTLNNDNKSLSSLYELVDIDFVYNGITDHVTLIDLRSWEEYIKCHIHKAIHVTIEASYLEPKDDNDIISNISQLISSHPQKLKVVYGKLVILYGDSSTNIKCYPFLLQLIDKQNCGDFRYYVMENPMNEFQSKYPFLCIWDNKIIQSTKEALFDQLYIENDDETDSKQIEESNISRYKRYSEILLQGTGYPNIIFSDKLYIGDGRQAMDSTIIYNLRITHILNVTRLVPNQFDGKHKNNISIPSVSNYFIKNPVQYLQFKVLDIDKQSFNQYFEKAFKFLDNAYNENNGNNTNKILIHCQQGISRSSTLLIAYLMYHEKWSLVDAYQHTKQCRKIINPNNGFLKQLMELEEKLFNRQSTVFQIQQRGIKDLKHFTRFLEGKAPKQRNEAKVLRDSVKRFITKQNK